jgi:hypothetical protein
MANNNPKHDERVCFNCEHMLWCVGIGLGVLCKHPANNPSGGRFFAVPSRRYTCEHFEARGGEARGGAAKEADGR